MSTSPRHLGRLAVIVLLACTGAGCSGHESNFEQRDRYPTVSRDGKWIAFTSNRAGEGIYVARFGAAARRITDPGNDLDVYPEWSPDGARIAFARSGEDAASRGLYVVNRDGSGLRQLTSRDDSSPSWSPGGKALAFERAEGSEGLDSSVRVIDLDGKNERVVVRDAEGPAWSPDGSRIAFVQGFVIMAAFDLRTKRSKRVVRSKVYVAAPAWSPDGTQIAYEDLSDVPSDTPYVIGIPEIYVVDVDGTRRRRLTRDKEIDQMPTWTSDGRIIFASSREGPLLLYIMNSDGTGVRRFR